MSNKKLKEPKRLRPYKPEVIDERGRGCYGGFGCKNPRMPYYLHYPAVAARCCHYVILVDLCQEHRDELQTQIDSKSHDPVWERDNIPLIEIEPAEEE